MGGEKKKRREAQPIEKPAITGQRKPYTPPAIDEEEVFEREALQTGCRNVMSCAASKAPS